MKMPAAKKTKTVAEKPAPQNKERRFTQRVVANLTNEDRIY